ncbi:MAG: hypothetical protein IKG01_01270 [Lachnospiraceae bacterium]|nr:hypothetical protein [Lachnospiraceae bacterium]
MKRLIAILLIIPVIIALGGCFLLRSSGSSQRKTITTYFDDIDENVEVVAARVWSQSEDKDGFVIIEANEEDLDELVEEINKTRLSLHFAHTDYFYKGFYGLELTLSDGTYLIYDCTSLDHTETPFDEKENRYDSIRDYYLEDVNKDFWERIAPYFPGMNTGRFSYGW